VYVGGQPLDGLEHNVTSAGPAGSSTRPSSPHASSSSSSEVTALRGALSAIPLIMQRALDAHREIGRSAGLLQSDALAVFPDVLQVSARVHCHYCALVEFLMWAKQHAISYIASHLLYCTHVGEE